jgi:F-type H+-transporting ATPase subunit alpha
MPALEQQSPPVAGAEFREALRRLESGSVRLECQVALDPGLVERVAAALSRAAGRPIAVEVKVNPRLASGATLYFGPDLKLDLDPRRKLLKDLEERAGIRPEERAPPAAPPPALEQAARRLAEIIESPVPRPRLEEIADRGAVQQVGDGVAIVGGLRGVRSQEVVRFENGAEGIAFNLLEDSVGCLLLGPERGIAEGSTVERTGRGMQVPVGDALIGRMINALGQPVDGRGPVITEETSPVERLSPGVVQRQPVTESLHSGIKVMDALVPLGRGQRELILGDRKIGKTTVAVDVILSQQGSGVVCVYAAIGQKASSLARVIRLLEERGAMAYTVIVVALSSDPPAFRYLTPYTACAIGEQVMAQGRDALVIYDDLSKHAVTYREISALLRRPIGREAYPGDIFYVHSRLLERAARLRDDLGGGSLTALPIVETLAGDISALIPTNVISICDGQIVLDSGLFNEDSRPAMDVGLSVSRVGGLAQTPAMRKVAGRLRIDLAQYREMARFVKFGAEVDEATLAQLRRGERELEVLKQGAHEPLPLEREIVILYAAVNGYTDDVPVERIGRFEVELYDFMEAHHPEVMTAIRETGDLTAAIEERLGAALRDFHDGFLGGLAGTVPGSDKRHGQTA